MLFARGQCLPSSVWCACEARENRDVVRAPRRSYIHLWFCYFIYIFVHSFMLLSILQIIFLSIYKFVCITHAHVCYPTEFYLFTPSGIYTFAHTSASCPVLRFTHLSDNSIHPSSIHSTSKQTMINTRMCTWLTHRDGCAGTINYV